MEKLPFEDLWVITIKVIEKIKNYDFVFFGEIPLLFDLTVKYLLIFSWLTT